VDGDDPEAPSWASGVYADREGRRWQMLDVTGLFSDDAFMDIGV
jgi:hypothetical protein